MRLITLIFFICSLTCFVEAFTIIGKVVAIADGDTCTVLYEKKQYKIRLEHIDTPEKKQAFGQDAKKALSDLIFGKLVMVAVSKQDRYKRHIGTIHIHDNNINLKMVELGFAWHYKKYSKDKAFADAEINAKKASLGLWNMENPVPPWKFRKK